MYVEAVDQVARDLVHRYAFDPAQEHKLGVGKDAIDVPRGLEFLLSLNRVNVFIFHASRLAGR